MLFRSMPTYQRFTEMEIWQKMSLVKDLYELTKSGPFSRDWALKDQLRRASISIPCNIAEGFERGGNKEFIQFLSYAKGSAGEVLTQMHIAYELDNLSKEDFNKFEKRVTRISYMLGGFMRYLKRSGQKGAKYRPKNRVGNHSPYTSIQPEFYASLIFDL